MPRTGILSWSLHRSQQPQDVGPQKPIRFLVHGLSLHKPGASSSLMRGWGLGGGGDAGPRNSPEGQGLFVSPQTTLLLF